MQDFDFTSLNDVAALASALPGPDEHAARAARARQDSLTKPPGSLGTLEDLAVFMAGWQGVERPRIEQAQALVFAGNHGVCARGVNPFPQEVTAQMVANFNAGGAAINQLCRVAGAELSVVALDLDRPTRDFTAGPAMDEAECLQAMRAGWEAVDLGADVLILGEMGIGNSTVAAALCAALFGGEASDWVGAGTGSDAEGRALKARVVAEGLALHGHLPPLGILAALGGREQAAIAGAVLAARIARVPVILDGFICTASAAPLHAADPAFLSHCLVGHRSAEAGHRRLLEALGKEPVLDFAMRLGEGTGAALALGVLRAALACHDGMATFADAGVSGG
ncbi:nicotinate-nucleotide--dimethylbenzimidazole phosphoribosyltransferase [Silicimonas algicola]|uniref:Nicotinate-nucleotide--dimethylbenzimidazole phosphoribosyltransferase n=1 Tax=Silicimonas algicola TaxID=1826607 RepID=A0A316GBB9_9RHOB|nr:nicotinate-nucleotide--dimethylbenzimidazole phosphoribosyltransferase [Silicimonas algicola]AZQ67289.1 nicotinate-nucleotide--dimethylbenzimidazole phosphoribosyltransferase [Silicimonas algicola]PWK56960.1 nicotinate-nucleotide-dimethylbenzimidazole phosphoribosyltransferase [Silicimonas algicola]